MIGDNTIIRPTSAERSKRWCDDDRYPCMFMTAGFECSLPACEYYKIYERVAPNDCIRLCRYHITMHEYAVLVDAGQIP